MHAFEASLQGSAASVLHFEPNAARFEPIAVRFEPIAAGHGRFVPMRYARRSPWLTVVETIRVRVPGRKRLRKRAPALTEIAQSLTCTA
jgi:hypothetical protein